MIKFIAPDPRYAQAFFEWRQDEYTIKYNPLAPTTIDSLRERLAKSASDFSQFSDKDAFLWFVECDGELAGQVSLQNINRMMLTAEIGYTIAPAARSKGVATASVSLLAKSVFELTPVRKLIAYVHDANLPSKRVLEKVGFRQEGLLRQHYIVNGQPADEAVYGLLRSEVKL